MTSGQPIFERGGNGVATVSVAVAKGQGLEVDPGNAGKARPWSAGSTTRIGVAQTAAGPASGNADNNLDPRRPHVNVQRAPQVVRMTFAAAATYRQPLIAASQGRVTPAGASPAWDTIVGYCDSPSGVQSGAVGAVQLLS